MKRKVVAITGKIGSGKSCVGNCLRQKGFAVMDCDDIARQVADSPAVIQDVENLLGNAAVVDGKLNRSYIRNVIFCDDILLKKYNAIFDKVLSDEIVSKINSVKQTVIFVEIPLIDRVNYPWSSVWVVCSDDQARYSRVAARDNVSENNAKSVSQSQQDYHCENCVIIDNCGSLHDLEVKVETALNLLLQDK